MPISGLLTRYDFDGGWPAAFYPFGKLTVTNDRTRFNEAVLRLDISFLSEQYLG